MKRRIIGAMVFLGALGGCMSTDTPPETGGVKPHFGKSFGPPMVPGLEGPYGTGVPMAAPYNTMPPGSLASAQRMMNNNMPMNMVQMNPMGMPMGGPPGAGMPAPMAQRHAPVAAEHAADAGDVAGRFRARRPDAADGSDGTDGPIAADGTDGSDAANGTDGARAADGSNGADGRFAPENELHEHAAGCRPDVCGRSARPPRRVA